MGTSNLDFDRLTKICEAVCQPCPKFISAEDSRRFVQEAGEFDDTFTPEVVRALLGCARVLFDKGVFGIPLDKLCWAEARQAALSSLASALKEGGK